VDWPIVDGSYAERPTDSRCNKVKHLRDGKSLPRRGLIDASVHSGVKEHEDGLAQVLHGHPLPHVMGIVIDGHWPRMTEVLYCHRNQLAGSLMTPNQVAGPECNHIKIIDVPIVVQGDFRSSL
jgi:hypothetical protein